MCRHRRQFVPCNDHRPETSRCGASLAVRLSLPLGGSARVSVSSAARRSSAFCAFLVPAVGLLFRCRCRFPALPCPSPLPYSLALSALPFFSAGSLLGVAPFPCPLCRGAVPALLSLSRPLLLLSPVLLCASCRCPCCLLFVFFGVGTNS